MKTKLCKCGKKMIKIDTGVVFTTDPPLYSMKWWCANCGREENAGFERGSTIEEQVIG